MVYVKLLYNNFELGRTDTNGKLEVSVLNCRRDESFRGIEEFTRDFVYSRGPKRVSRCENYNNVWNCDDDFNTSFQARNAGDMPRGYTFEVEPAEKGMQRLSKDKDALKKKLLKNPIIAEPNSKAFYGTDCERARRIARAVKMAEKKSKNYATSLIDEFGNRTEYCATKCKGVLPDDIMKIINDFRKYEIEGYNVFFAYYIDRKLLRICIERHVCKNV